MGHDDDSRRAARTEPQPQPSHVSKTADPELRARVADAFGRPVALPGCECVAVPLSEHPAAAGTEGCVGRYAALQFDQPNRCRWWYDSEKRRVAARVTSDGREEGGPEERAGVAA